MTPDLPRRPPAVLRDTWSDQLADCSRDNEFGGLDEALHVRTMHAGHGPWCLQALSAVAFIGGHAGDEYE